LAADRPRQVWLPFAQPAPAGLRAGGESMAASGRRATLRSSRGFARVPAIIPGRAANSTTFPKTDSSRRLRCWKRPASGSRPSTCRASWVEEERRKSHRDTGRSEGEAPGVAEVGRGLGRCCRAVPAMRGVGLLSMRAVMLQPPGEWGRVLLEDVALGSSSLDCVPAVCSVRLIHAASWLGEDCFH